MPPSPDRTRRRRGRLCRAGLVWAAMAAGGCESLRGAKVDHPVLGPPPPRVSWDDSPAPGPTVADASVADASGDDPSGGKSGLVKVSLSDPAPITDHSVVAIVNGEPILAGQLLAPFNSYFVQAAAAGRPEWEIEAGKKEVLKKSLDARIDQTLLVQALRLMLKSEQLKQVEEKLDEAFEKHNAKIMEAHGVNTRAELERILAERGASLAEYEQTYKNRELAKVYLQFKLGEKETVIGRQDIVDYYQSHLDKFTHPARVRFQLLMVSFAANGGAVAGKDKAREKIEAALAELRQGVPFPDVVKKYSDGPKASRGGQHDWFKRGDFSAKEVDAALFSVPVGRMSDVIETTTPKAFIVVKVTEREEEGRSPLASVQDEIRATLMSEAHQKTVEGLLTKLRENAVVTKYVD